MAPSYAADPRGRLLAGHRGGAVSSNVRVAMIKEARRVEAGAVDELGGVQRHYLPLEPLARFDVREQLMQLPGRAGGGM